MLFIALPAVFFFSTFLILIKSLLLHASLLGSYFSSGTRCSVLSLCSTRSSLDATHWSYFTSCYLLIRCLLVLTRCYLSLLATDRPRLVLAARCLRTVKSGLLILRRCSLCAASLWLPLPRISLCKRFAIFYLLWAPVTPNLRNFDQSRL